MKKSIFFSALIAIVSVLTGCNQHEFQCPYGQCVDDFGYCVPCYGGGTYPLQWEPVPGHGLIYLHNGAGISTGINTMTDEFGMVVYVKIGADIYGPANILATQEMQNGAWARPLLVTYAIMQNPINHPAYGPIYRVANKIELCTMCGWF